MRIKALLATIVGAVALQSATAGSSWSPPSHGGKETAVDCCPDIGGEISFGYDTDYVFKGVRLARDVVWTDVNYTFENLPFSPTIGVLHLSSLGSSPSGGLFPTSGSDRFGDQTDFYASINLPSVLGFDTAFQYTHFLFPTTRGPSGTPSNGGDSTNQFTFSASRQLFAGVRFSYSLDYLNGATVFANPFNNFRDDEVGGFLHTFALSKSFTIGDRASLELTGGAYYNDNYFSQGVNSRDLDIAGRGNNAANDSGWHSYFLEAALPVAISHRATLRPYIRYNGTPDGWTADNLAPINYFGSAGSSPIAEGANRNELLYGGVSVKIDF